MYSRTTCSADWREAAAPIARTPGLLLVPFVLGGFVDLPGIIRIGSVTLLGALSLAQLALAAAGLIALRAYPRSLLARFAPFAAFVFWMTLRSAIERPSQGGMQNLVAYLLFGAQFLLAGTLISREPVSTMRALRRGFLVLDIVGLALVFVSLLRAGLPTEGGGEWLVGPRSVALLAIVPLSWHFAGWAHGRPGSALRALVWLLAVLVTLSRTATAVALIIAAVAYAAQWWIAPGRLLRQLPAVAVGAGLLVVLVALDAGAFQARFFEGHNNIEVGGIAISTSGRDSIWPVVIESGLRSPIVGLGLGSSQAALQDFDVAIGHPHNDYLRVWHDGGLIGVALLVFAFLRWLGVLGRQWSSAVRMSMRGPEVGLAGLMTLGGIMLASITDNGLIYAFVMSLAGLLIGAAMGQRAQEQDEHGHPAAPIGCTDVQAGA